MVIRGLDLYMDGMGRSGPSGGTLFRAWVPGSVIASEEAKLRTYLRYDNLICAIMAVETPQSKFIWRDASGRLTSAMFANQTQVRRGKLRRSQLPRILNSKPARKHAPIPQRERYSSRAHPAYYLLIIDISITVSPGRWAVAKTASAHSSIS